VNEAMSNIGAKKKEPAKKKRKKEKERGVNKNGTE